MSRSAGVKDGRRKLLSEKLKAQPYLTDGELASAFNVSIPTIRLDRLSMGIPELKERLKELAADSGKEHLVSFKKENGMHFDIEKGVRGISIMETDDSMCFPGTHIVRGSHIYAMAADLAAAIIGTDVVFAQVGNIKYKTPVTSGSRLVARGEIREQRGTAYILWIKVYDKDSEAYRGKFIVNTLMSESKED